MIRVTIILISLLGICTSMFGQVAIVNQGNYSSTTFSHTVGVGGQRILLFIIAAEFNSTSTSISGVTYGGVSMTNIGTSSINQTGGSPNKRDQIAAYYINESQITSASSSTAVISFSGTYVGAPSEGVGIEAFTLLDVDQTTPAEDARTASQQSSSSVNANPNINADTYDMVFACGISSGSTSTFTPPTGYIERADRPASNMAYNVNTQLRSNNGTTDPTITNSASNRLAMLSFEINVGTLPLPIELLSFEAIKGSNKVDLKWLTSTEVNNDYFTVERSFDGVIWEAIAIVDGAGTSTIQRYYETIDLDLRPGTRYYRLKQTDFNGEYSYSTIIAVEYYAFINGPPEFQIYPNPSNGTELSIAVQEMELNQTTITIYDLRGEKVFSYPIINSIEGQVIHLEFDQLLPPAVYQVQILTNNKVYTKKFIVQ